MKRFFRQIFILFNLFVIVILPIILLLQILVYPLWETAWCGEHFCRTIEYHVIYSRVEFANATLKDKENLELYEVKDNILPIKQYFLRTHKSVYNSKKERYEDDERLVFSSGYLSKKNALRDLEYIKSNIDTKVVKKNVGLIQFLCIGIYVIVMCFGIIITMIIREVKEYNGKMGSGENIEVEDM